MTRPLSRISRRRFLQGGASLGVLGASKALFPDWMPSLAFASDYQKAPGDVLVTVFLRGGMDGLSAVAPSFEGADYFGRRPTVAVAEGRSLELDGRFVLHEALAPLKELFDDEMLAFVQATGSPDDTRSHFDAMQYMEQGTPGEKGTNTGWLGRHLQSAAWQNESPFRAVGMGTIVPQALRGEVTPLALRSIADFHFRGRRSEMQRLQTSLASLYAVAAPSDALQTQAKLVFETVDLLAGFRGERYQPSGGATYPRGEYGRGLRQVAQLIKAEVGLEVACVDLGGWDTHEAQGTVDGRFSALLAELAQGLHAFATDLGDKMRAVSVVTMSEFGRRVEENASAGTDHGHGNLMMILGGGARGGKVHGDWPGLSDDALIDGDLAVTTDYRDVLSEIVRGRLLNPALDKVFPKHTAKALGIVTARES